jgi:hypothetical protein
MAWLYALTQGSLLAVMVMHAAANNTKDIVPSAAAVQANPFHFAASPIGWMTTIVLWIAAVYFLWSLRSFARDTALAGSAGDVPGGPRR